MPIIDSIQSTYSVGKRITPTETAFFDVDTYGQFPLTQEVTHIDSIEIFGSGDGTTAIVDGLTIIYSVNGQPTPSVTHGLASNSLGVLAISENQVLVGASGRLKKTTAGNPTKDGRISFIIFTLYDTVTGQTTVSLQYGSGEEVGDAWGNFGPIIAFSGTESTQHGLTSLGFCKVVPSGGAIF